MNFCRLFCIVMLCQNLAFANLNQTELNSNSILKQDLNSTSQLNSNEPKKLDFSISSLYLNADIVVKAVILILVLFSVLTWAVFFTKFFMYRALLKSLKRDKICIENLKNFDDLSKFNTKSIAKNLIQEMKDERAKSAYNNAALKKRIKIRLKNKILIYVNDAKSLTALLASIGSSAPFIGLFGTVWGIMNAFIGISQQESVSLAVVAPGIAEALFATAFGLAAAIPAVLFYNYLVRLGANFAHKLDENATMLYIIDDRELSKADK